jgi:hypothetical protein
MKPVLVYLDIPQAWGFASISATDSLFGAAGLLEKYDIEIDLKK